jgi:hypothetical protein
MFAPTRSVRRPTLLQRAAELTRPDAEIIRELVDAAAVQRTGGDASLPTARGAAPRRRARSRARAPAGTADTDETRPPAAAAFEKNRRFCATSRAPDRSTADPRRRNPDEEHAKPGVPRPRARVQLAIEEWHVAKNKRRPRPRLAIFGH